MITTSTEELIHNIPKGLLNWYNFRKDTKILYIGKQEDSYREVLQSLSEELVTVDISEITEEWVLKYTDRFDYIVCVAYLEEVKEPITILKLLRKTICCDGHLLLGMNNRLGVRYFCGDRDPYTDRNFDGVEGYRRAYVKKEDAFLGRCYSKGEIRTFLNEAGWEKNRFFSVFSDLKNPSLILSETYRSNEDLSNRIFPTYHYSQSVFLEEESLYKTLIQEGMFHEMANGFLVECSVLGSLSDVLQVTSSMERGRANALLTVIRENGTVEKKCVFPEGKQKLKKLKQYSDELRERGLLTVDTILENDVLSMPFVEYKTGQVYLKELLHKDMDKFLLEMDHFRDLILKSSEIAEADKRDGNGAILKKGYFDMVPLNSFFINGEFVFYDQEFCVENYSANVLIWRMIASFYYGDMEASKLLPMDVLLERYDLKRNLKEWQRKEWEFLAELKNDKELWHYHQKCRRDANIVNSNRQRINYSADDYQKLFIDIFKNADTRKLILFGSGNFTKKFLMIYGKDYPVYAIIDNNQEKWGEEIDGIVIQSPEILKTLKSGEYKVIICIKNYISVMKQLEELGVGEYSIYDWNKDYPRPLKRIASVHSLENKEKKKYNIGYVAGAFDMFHVGHLNLLRKAKEQCNYLIVGVIADETIYNLKEKYPVIPCEERVEIVASCRYVDQAEALPKNYAGIRDAYRMFQFDVQFSGDDHNGEEGWIKDKEFLEKQGADIVFFPYTEKVSSTMLREKITEKTGDEMKVVCIGEIEGKRINKWNVALSKAGFKDAMIDLSCYCSEYLLENREEVYQKYLKRKRPGEEETIFLTREPERMEEAVRFYMQRAQNLGFKNVIVKAPSMPYDTERTDSDELIERLTKASLQLCKKSGSKYLIVEPNVKKVKIEDDRKKSQEFYLSFAEEAKQLGVMILIRNSYNIHNGHFVRGFWSDSYELKAFIEMLNEKAGSEVFGICMDIGVCNLLGQNMYEFTDVLRNNIKAVIIRDNDGVTDNSLIPFSSSKNGKSKMDWLNLIKGLRNIEFDGLLIYNFRDSIASVSHLLQADVVHYAKKMADFLTWQISMEQVIKKYEKRVLFGAGNMCRNYMKCYGEEYRPLFTCDNNSNIWGTQFEGLTIKNPKELKELPEDCAIFICNIYYDEIEQQLRDMRIKNPIERYNDEYLPSMYTDRFDADIREVR